jgi:hypothetical protein
MSFLCANMWVFIADNAVKKRAAILSPAMDGERIHAHSLLLCNAMQDFLASG